VYSLVLSYKQSWIDEESYSKDVLHAMGREMDVRKLRGCRTLTPREPGN